MSLAREAARITFRTGHGILQHILQTVYDPKGSLGLRPRAVPTETELLFILGLT